MSWISTEPKIWSKSPVKAFGTDWSLITSGVKEGWNTMTASWGGLGVLWNKPIAYIFIRPSRYTYQFVEDQLTLSLCFFDPEYKDISQQCGSRSGREWNKMAELGLTSFITSKGYIGFEEANTIIGCTVRGSVDMEGARILDPSIQEQYYSHGDSHRLYFAEIKEFLVKEE